MPTAGQVQRRIRQYRALTDEATCLRLARRWRWPRSRASTATCCGRPAATTRVRRRARRTLTAIQPLLARIADGGRPRRLRGLEGAAAVHYFAGLRTRARLRRCPRSCARRRATAGRRWTASTPCSSYGYGLLHTAVMRAVLASGLEPALGFFHTPRSAAYPLVLDLMELFRVPLWDMVLVGSLNRGQWDPDADFVVTRAKVWLSEAGRKKAIGLFEARLEETWKHPVLNYSLSYARTIELEARLLEKEWTGEPGLFARCAVCGRGNADARRASGGWCATTSATRSGCGRRRSTWRGTGSGCSTRCSAAG